MNKFLPNLLIVSLFILVIPATWAQTPLDSSQSSAQDIALLDSTWQAFRQQQRYQYRTRVFNGTPTSGVSGSAHPQGLLDDSTYRERLRLLCHRVPMEYNGFVKNQIEHFVSRKRAFFEEMLGLEHVYFPIFEQVLDEMGLPLELRYLAIIESGLRPAAKSRVAATGLWQFMHYTARLYDLRMDSFIDERSDPYKSTYAAAQYLRHLHSLYDDWLLAIAAYNCGPGRVNWAIRKAGAKTYWEIYPYLPRETRGYVPAYIAACYLMNYWQSHGLSPVWVDFEYGPDSLVVVGRELRLEFLAKLAGTDANQLYAMNPSLKLGVVPYSDQPFTVRIPHQVALYVEQNPDTIYTHVLLAESGNPSEVAPETAPTYVPPGRRLIYHPVKAGETLLSIAYYYKVYVNELKEWNGLSASTLAPGQPLKVFVRTNSPITEAPTRSTAQGGSSSATKASQPAPQNGKKSGGYTTYQVRNGDSLWTIAQRFPGVTVEEILKLNALPNANKIRPGQTLKIPTR